ncbi:MAG: hypothetical protein EBR82_61485 [Caulobacteraceae bacterium]|nr:hypothetical protein [Caulobacteraceae bacterium]
MTATSPKSFAAFILTHGRPNQVITYDTLRKAGYTGDIYLIIDNEDKTADDYYRIYGTDKVIMFDKKAAGETFDIADTRTDRRATVYARNASFDIAKRLGLEYFMQLDDDYNGFRFRSYSKETDHFESISIKSLDKVFTAMIELLDKTKAKSIALSQGGDWIGGTGSHAAREPLMRKCMNSWLFRTDTPVKFIGRMNDDVNTYTVYGSRGDLFFTCSAVQLDAIPTQKGAGGMTEMYLDTGTYMKSFYTVMMLPSCVTVRPMGGATFHRLHHHVKWGYAVPKIISDQHRKPR